MIQSIIAAIAGALLKAVLAWQAMRQGRADAQSAAVSEAEAKTQTVITEVIDDQRKIAGDAPADARVLSDRLRKRAATDTARDRGKVG